MKMINHLDVVKSTPPKLKYVGRTPISVFLSMSTDIVLSHQWENPLNYAYLDAIYYGYPLVHNADMVKDAGYYYNGFDVSGGAEQLKYALEEHDNNLEEYSNKNKSALNRYLSTNPDVVDTYRKLIENLFKPGSHKMSYNYNWKTNLYK